MHVTDLREAIRSEEWTPGYFIPDPNGRLLLNGRRGWITYRDDSPLPLLHDARDAILTFLSAPICLAYGCKPVGHNTISHTRNCQYFA